MSHVPSNMATYCNETGKPVYDTFFVSADLGNGLELYAYQSFQDRESVLIDFQRGNVNCQALGHHEAFQLACGGMRAWINEGGADYAPLYLNRSNGIGWRPVVIDGGRAALAVPISG